MKTGSSQGELAPGGPGIKDSSGDFVNTKAMLERFQPHDFDVYCGGESFLLATLRAGGAGCISATANVNPRAIARLAREWRSAEADTQQAALDAVRQAFKPYPMIATLKETVARFARDDTWRIVRPPLLPLATEHRASLRARLDALAFDMSGLAA